MSSKLLLPLLPLKSLKCNDLESPSIFLACCDKLIRPYQTPVVSLKYLNPSLRYSVY